MAADNKRQCWDANYYFSCKDVIKFYFGHDYLAKTGNYVKYAKPNKRSFQSHCQIWSKGNLNKERENRAYLIIVY